MTKTVTTSTNDETARCPWWYAVKHGFDLPI